MVIYRLKDPVGAVMIDDQSDNVRGSGLGTEIPLPFNRYIVHTYHNGKRDNINFGSDRLDDVMDWLRIVMARCPIGPFKAEIWDCLTYKLFFTADDHITGPCSDILQ
jgi:hypothetical protein